MQKEIDLTGKVRQITPAQLVDFSAWLKKAYNYGIEKKYNSEVHIEKLFFCAMLIDIFTSGRDVKAYCNDFKNKSLLFTPAYDLLKEVGADVMPADRVFSSTRRITPIEVLRAVKCASDYAREYGLQYHVDAEENLDVFFCENAGFEFALCTPNPTATVGDAESAIMAARANRLVKGAGITEKDFFSKEFQKQGAIIEEYSTRKTGLDVLDKKQIFAPGLYVLGGLPSSGKSTLAWQIADYLALTESVVYFSYEMSAFELYTKTIARELFKDSGGKLPLSSINIRRRKYETSAARVEEKIKSLIERDGGVYVYKIEEETTAEVIQLMEGHCDAVDVWNAENPDKTPLRAPVFVIDYLQLVAVGAKEIRGAIDEFVLRLKNLQKARNATVICISSFNRDNYFNVAGYESFKESGGIENTADVVLALQFNCVKSFDKQTTSEKRETLQAARKENPRRMNLVCLKNRFGELYDVDLEYYPAVDFFKCDEFAEMHELARAQYEENKRNKRKK